MPCKIEKKTEHRKITLDEFKRQKNSKYYKNFRQMAKSENFLLIFGGSSSVLSEQALEISWTPEQVDEFLNDNDCSSNLEKVKNTYRNYDTIKQKYIAVSDYIRENFFKSYPGLIDRCDREVKYAEDNGFCRSVFGMTRNFIELKLKGSYDEKEYSGRLRNMSNQAKNVLAQQYEACIRGRAMREINEWLIKNNYKSRIWNEIHDSQDMYLHKDEMMKVLPHWKHICERKVPELTVWNTWVSLDADCEIADLRAPSHNYYKGGASPESFGVNWDENLKYEDVDPFDVELSEEFDKEYFEGRKKYWEEKGEEDPLKDKIESYLKKYIKVRQRKA